MRRPRNPNPLPTLSDNANVRAHGRMHGDGITCNLGRIENLSASGMRVRVRGRLHVAPLQTIPLTIHGPLGPFTLTGKIVWTQKLGFRRHDVGVQFVEIHGGARQQLNSLARFLMHAPTVYQGAA